MRAAGSNARRASIIILQDAGHKDILAKSPQNWDSGSVSSGYSMVGIFQPAAQIGRLANVRGLAAPVEAS